MNSLCGWIRNNGDNYIYNFLARIYDLRGYIYEIGTHHNHEEMHQDI